MDSNAFRLYNSSIMHGGCGAVVNKAKRMICLKIVSSMVELSYQKYLKWALRLGLDTILSYSSILKSFTYYSYYALECMREGRFVCLLHSYIVATYMVYNYVQREPL